MNKIMLLLFVSSFSLLVNAKEPTVAILQNIDSNSVQKFTLVNSSFYCDAYALLSLDKLSKRNALNVTCRKSLNKFYATNPQAKYFSRNNLKVMQMYHLEFKNGECILFASGEITLSELLLKEGLAILKPNFNDHEYKGVFRNAQESAKIEKKGVWSTSVMRDCAAEIYKN